MEMEMEMEMIGCPIHYTGNKFKRLPEINEHIRRAGHIETFFEPFGGSAVVGINALALGLAQQYRYNDANTKVMMMMFSLLSTGDGTIARIYELNDHYPPTKEGYHKLRDDFNSSVSVCDYYQMLFLLQCRSFNNQTRFNKKGKFNLPYGERNYVHTIIENLKLAQQVYQTHMIGFSSNDFEVSTVNATISDFVMLDPPYEGTVATYNDKWKTADTERLIAMCDRLDDRGVRWMLTTTTHNRGKLNSVALQKLEDHWLKNSRYNVVEIGSNIGYHNSSYFKTEHKTVEVLITNY